MSKPMNDFFCAHVPGAQICRLPLSFCSLLVLLPGLSLSKSNHCCSTRYLKGHVFPLVVKEKGKQAFLPPSVYSCSRVRSSSRTLAVTDLVSVTPPFVPRFRRLPIRSLVLAFAPASFVLHLISLVR
ncbi:hypothetical protein BDV36DRAFT_121446 [Aspergillus pseudocaelatus]|uniref:Transmembrane protein n=1 Tax=Aspergillus pseudocaelatus TaxID=1825620 RepID=A0ABQ6VZX3_9EURO|nr:hypothetical protein BDV36DRAFT_121446 [Aspergillus pseudocaelatus]